MSRYSDRGCQYSSKSFQKMLEEHEIVGSMSTPACPYDNACMESFFSSAKRECIYRKQYDNIEAVKTDLFEYIELFYNRKRMDPYMRIIIMNHIQILLMQQLA